MPRKRTRDEMEASAPEEKKTGPSILQRIRNMWEFASIMQFIFIFGKAIKIDEDFDIEDFEEECLKPGYSEKLEEIGLTLLKWISSHRGLDYTIWDEYTRRQYLAKAPHLNPYGEEETPKRFRDFDIFTKIRVLHQLTVWTFWNPDRIREKMPDHPREVDQLEWRIEEFGYDGDDRQYYLLDDNRFYRRTDPPPPPVPKAKPKANSKKAIAARRRESKRRRLEAELEDTADEHHEGNDESHMADEKTQEPWEIDTFGGFKWECIAITLTDYRELCESLKRSKDPNEKFLRERLISEVLPVIEAAEEKQRRKIERRQRELLMMERMVGAKRSSRLADKHDRERREAEEAEAERKKQADLAAAHREMERQEKMEQERQFRMLTREQRIRDREYKRLLKEEELARDAIEQKKIEEGEIRGSDRHLKQRIEKNKKELEDLNNEEEWTFDCSGCGVHGKNIDDGSHSVACERCSVWQHSKCLNISKSAAEKDDFHFVCRDCRRKEAEANKPKISLKFKVGTSSSPAPPSPALPVPQSPQKSSFASVEIPRQNAAGPSSQGSTMNGSPAHQSSPSSRPPSSPYHPRHIQSNGFPQQYPQGAGISQQGSPSAGLHQQPSGSHQFIQYVPGYPPQQSAHMVGNGFARNPPQPSAHAPSHNGTAYQFQNYPYEQRHLASAQDMPRQQTQSPANRQATNSTGRLPSPVFNRPMMSPTQGNMDVGPVAGIPQKSPSLGQNATNGVSVNGLQPQPNGVASQVHATPRASSQPYEAQTPTTQPISGLSPRKQPTPQHFPPPSIMIQKRNSMSPTLQASAVASGHAEKRTVSGTPVLPPIENLRPSPEQMRKMSSNEPVPTPSKQPQPSPTMAGADPGEFSNFHSSSSPPDKMEDVQHVTGAEVKTS
ncbi:hypothetical protein PV08_03054 [Exophiala spinifera]|uniref:PHD-type domain-containing protein n=1 Tax=Exophiala spinifera TaxID=91928 RepID=A0A0D2BJI4_9EURO|nr:uncharacterized protein PV08_03054 [Exophiala spinifera]KIW18765.1 hypothetical protein PV08_03054 [Exophiala spinifera]